MSDSESIPVVGVGASAGGLEALQGLFAALPDDAGIAYVVVQHLSPDFKSLMSELLSKHTKMAVVPAEDGQKAEPNTIYLTPAGKFIRIAENHFYLSDMSPEQHLNLPINELFRSLAEDAQNQSIGVVLSGTGSDGTHGIEAIHAVGGMVLVQEPDEAAFTGMPDNASQSGIADLVAPVKVLAEQIGQWVQRHQSPVIRPLGELVDMASADVELLRKIIERLNRDTEIDATAYKESVIARRIEHRISALNLENFQEYGELIESSPEEVSHLKESLWIGVTQFFRDPEVWTAFNEHVVSTLLNDIPNNEPIRVWSAGCSTGEEAYSIAIAFANALGDEADFHRVKVFATDVDPTAIAYASQGIYPASIEGELPAEYVAKYFSKLPNGNFQATKRLRAMVVFATHNMIQDPPFSNMHLVVCRNTLIYMQPQTQLKSLAFFHFALKLNGFLLLGSAETPGSNLHYFSTVDAKRRIYRKTRDVRIPLSALSSRRTSAGEKPRPFLARTALSGSGFGRTEKPMGLDTVLERYAPPTIIINAAMQVVYSYGDTGPFTQKLRPGAVDNSLQSLLDEKIYRKTQSTVHEVARTQTPLTLKAFMEIEDLFWDLEAYTVSTGQDQDPLFAVSFVQSERQRFNVNKQGDIAALEPSEQLMEYQDLYFKTSEELASTRQELQSSNEELMATNEELQSTNEELQSVNEELYTVNSENQQRIQELIERNNDLENLINTNQMGVLVLTETLQIRRFTPEVRRYLNILEYDLNRDIRDLSFRNDFEGLSQLITETQEQGEKRVKRYPCDNHWVEVVIAPYRVGDQLQGVLITFQRQEQSHG